MTPGEVWVFDVSKASFAFLVVARSTAAYIESDEPEGTVEVLVLSKEADWPDSGPGSVVLIFDRQQHIINRCWRVA